MALAYLLPYGSIPVATCSGGDRYDDGHAPTRTRVLKFARVRHSNLLTSTDVPLGSGSA